MGASVELAIQTAAPVIGRVAEVEAFKTIEQRQRDIILNTAALHEAALEDMTDQGIAYMESLLRQVKADLNYCRRNSDKEGLTGM
jgi:hypothetical protein